MTIKIDSSSPSDIVRTQNPIRLFRQVTVNPALIIVYNHQPLGLKPSPRLIALICRRIRRISLMFRLPIVVMNLLCGAVYE